MVKGDEAIPQSYQEYLETIFRMQDAKDEYGEDCWITNQDIAKQMNIKPPSVTEMFEKLEETGFVTWRRRKGVRLNAKGLKEGEHILKSHHLIEKFLRLILHIDDSEFNHRIACSMEHILFAEPRLAKAIEDTIKSSE